MAGDWFCRMSGREFGPVSMEHLRLMLQRGRLSPDDRVRQGAKGPWLTARDVGGLLPADDASSGSSRHEALPVAKPIKAPAVKARPAASRPKGAGSPVVKPADQDPLEAIADADSTMRITDRSSRTATSAELREREKAKIKKTVVAACGIAAVVAVIAIFLKLALSESTGGLDSMALRLEKAKEEAELEAARKAAEPPKDETPSPPQEPQEIKWCDASKSSLDYGDLNVKIVSAVIGRPQVVSPSGQVGKWMDPLLMIAVELKNNHKTNKATYSSWAAAGITNLGVTLTDSYARYCPPYKAFHGYSPQQQLTGKAVIDPGATVKDLLLFVNPVEDDKPKYLRLRLPGAAIGHKEVLAFEIPWEMVTKIVEPEPTSPKPKRPAGAKPEGPPGETPRAGTPERPPGTENPNKALQLEETYEEGKRLEEGKPKGDPNAEDDGDTRIEKQHDKVPGAASGRSVDPSEKPVPVRKGSGKPNPAEELLKKKMF